MSFWENMFKKTDSDTKSLGSLAYSILAELKESNRLAEKQFQELEELKSEMNLLRRQFFEAEKLIGVSKSTKTLIGPKKLARSSNNTEPKEPIIKMRKLTEENKTPIIKNSFGSAASSGVTSFGVSLSSPTKATFEKSQPTLPKAQDQPSTSSKPQTFTVPASDRDSASGSSDSSKQSSGKEMRKNLEKMIKTDEGKSEFLSLFMGATSGGSNVKNMDPKSESLFETKSGMEEFERKFSNTKQIEETTSAGRLSQTIDLTAVQKEQANGSNHNTVSRKLFRCKLCNRSYKQYQGGIVKHLTSIHNLSPAGKNWKTYYKEELVQN